ncbi:hypothetical protein GCM10025869_24370 [Homoserinibacter gongjuensis]|uniref:NAD-dependent DNA ligase N-terminal domain-containing protein n=1 Tax=Homoserinibacter gongjuensis TaxID=1162968 RepID=A0ABQ6JWZ6_9MICO|nr:hypothetical protein GCM10025869_24370 [Homoserinibacter gongjuensis]
MARGAKTDDIEQLLDETSAALQRAHEEADALTSRILELREAYYEHDTSLVDDAEYDAMMRRLEELERLFPELQSQDSPTQTVGGGVEESGLATIQHAERMLSLDNVFSAEELRDWCVKTADAAGRAVHWLTELKIDGLAINLRYENGVLTSAATRGDGRVGEIVTENALRLADVPERLSGTGHPALVEVRGEVFIPVKAFEGLNELQAELRERAFQDAGAGPRGAARRSTRRRRGRQPHDASRRSRTRATRHPAACASNSTRKTGSSSRRHSLASARCGCSCTASARGRTRPCRRRARSTSCSPGGACRPLLTAG